MDITYDPRCSMYLKRKTYYASYYLPNRARICRALHRNKVLAKRMLHRKEKELLEGVFDDRDVLKMPEIQFSAKSRLELPEAADKYLKSTSAGRKPKTQINDVYALKSLVGRFQKQYVDEVRLYDVQLLLNGLIDEGKSQATLKSYRGILKKFFGWIEESGLAEIRSPVTKKVVIPETTGLVRERLPSKEEVSQLVSDSCVVQPLIRFLAFTGCRLGEALHLEWNDIEKGLWMIRKKPECPTAYGTGWSPKWNKRRDVILFREALDVIESQPRTVRWVFPKPDGTRRDSLKRSWASLKRRNGVKDFQLKDLRTWFNHVLKSEFGFTTKEASAYLGHSPDVNEAHYDPVSEKVVREKLGVKSLTATLLLPGRC